MNLSSGREETYDHEGDNRDLQASCHWRNAEKNHLTLIGGEVKTLLDQRHYASCINGDCAARAICNSAHFIAEIGDR